MPDNSIRRLLGLAITALIIETPLMQTAIAADAVSLFKVVTTKDEIVIGMNVGELAQLDSKDAGGVAKFPVGK
jgi:flagellar biosynthesis protein FliR